MAKKIEFTRKTSKVKKQPELTPRGGMVSTTMANRLQQEFISCGWKLTP